MLCELVTAALCNDPECYENPLGALDLIQRSPLPTGSLVCALHGRALLLGGKSPGVSSLVAHSLEKCSANGYTLYVSTYAKHCSKNNILQ